MIAVNIMFFTHQARIRRTRRQILPCSWPSRGRSQRSRPVVAGTPTRDNEHLHVTTNTYTWKRTPTRDNEHQHAK